MDHIFEAYHLQSNEANNTINLELPLPLLLRALRSALHCSQANLRLTKRDGIPVLSMTIHTTTKDATTAPGGAFTSRGPANPFPHAAAAAYDVDDDANPFDDDAHFAAEPLDLAAVRRGGREKVITQDIPVRVLHPDTVETIMQPKVREPDVHIQLPPLLQLKALSDRFTRLAAAAAASSSSSTSTSAGTTATTTPRLELAANMHGALRLRIATEALDITSTWDGLANPELDPAQLAGPLEEHPSTRFREAGPERWATVRVDGRDWSRVLSVGRLEGRVIACFADDHALILYVYVPQYDEGAGAEDSVVTVRGSLFFFFFFFFQISRDAVCFPAS